MYQSVLTDGKKEKYSSNQFISQSLKCHIIKLFVFRKPFLLALIMLFLTDPTPYFQSTSFSQHEGQSGLEQVVLTPSKQTWRFHCRRQMTLAESILQEPSSTSYRMPVSAQGPPGAQGHTCRNTDGSLVTCTSAPGWCHS